MPIIQHESSFEAFRLSEETQKALRDMGFTKPTPVQAATYAPVVEGHDLMVQSHTGSGKTAAFGIPLAEMLSPLDKRVQALILLPTRELANQVSEELSRVFAYRDLSVAAIYGGAGMGGQIAELKAGAQVVAGTPGRVLDHLRRGTLVLSALRVLVLDEADEMLSMGFAKDLDAILEFLPTERQSMLFSATLPEDIRELGRRFLNNPEMVSLSDSRVGSKDITHYYYLLSGMAKQRDLIRVLRLWNPEDAIIFCNTREDTHFVANYMRRQGFDAEELSGDLPQAEREIAMGKIKRKELRFLVATDVAARGIDISELSHVINFSIPEYHEVYIHRTGRTGRAGRAGTAISLVSPQDLGNFVMIRKLYKIEAIEKTFPLDMEPFESKPEIKAISRPSLAAAAAPKPMPSEAAPVEKSAPLVVVVDDEAKTQELPAVNKLLLARAPEAPAPEPAPVSEAAPIVDVPPAPVPAVEAAPVVEPVAIPAPAAVEVAPAAAEPIAAVEVAPVLAEAPVPAEEVKPAQESRPLNKFERGDRGERNRDRGERGPRPDRAPEAKPTEDKPQPAKAEAPRPQEPQLPSLPGESWGEALDYLILTRDLRPRGKDKPAERKDDKPQRKEEAPSKPSQDTKPERKDERGERGDRSERGDRNRDNRRDDRGPRRQPRAEETTELKPAEAKPEEKTTEAEAAPLLLDTPAEEKTAPSAEAAPVEAPAPVEEPTAPSAAPAPAEEKATEAAPTPAPEIVPVDEPSTPAPAEEKAAEAANTEADLDEDADTEDNSEGEDGEEGQGARMARLYVNLGRRDNVRASEVTRFLRDHVKLTRRDLGRVQVRDTFSHIGIRAELADEVIKNLSGQKYKEKDVVVELAKGRSF